jgi:hypothetical protein
MRDMMRAMKNDDNWYWEGMLKFNIN